MHITARGTVIKGKEECTANSASRFIHVLFFTSERRGIQSLAIEKARVFGCIQLTPPFRITAVLTQDSRFPETTARSYRGNTWIIW